MTKQNAVIVEQSTAAARSLADVRRSGVSTVLHAQDQGVLIVVDTEIPGQAALLVDAICDQRQFVIKSLDTHFGAFEGIAGATILGEGRIALILASDGLVARAFTEPERQAA